ncbi:hypothetical protein CSA56_11755 [candidate division KSB3 bacterium]|uniref:2-oxoacid dehydrogenase acyltransferase catalytic domain-containing protein n=1 Tax=candidate division KSB3 bacterium TaxID=2044937 RepID=A0A2G6KEU2_9BACT|nr:MAG: hypothetical protein CSA56_11755 [candidate division KSB3 bacterium]
MTHDDYLDANTQASVQAEEVLTLDHIRTERFSSIPQFQVSIEIDASTMLERINACAEDHRPSFTTLLIHEVGQVIQSFPLMNATFTSDETIQLHPHVHIAVAVDTPAGTTFPVLQNVTQQPVMHLHHEIRRLTEKARDAGLDPEETENATLTLINLGKFGVAEARVNVKPPQITALTVGAINYRLVMTGNRIINVPFFRVNVACDARVVDATMPAKFLQKLEDGLEG